MVPFDDDFVPGRLHGDMAELFGAGLDHDDNYPGRGAGSGALNCQVGHHIQSNLADSKPHRSILAQTPTTIGHPHPNDGDMEILGVGKAVAERGKTFRGQNA